MSKVHNKKRNVGIMYELLLRFISDSIIEDNKKAAKSALSIIEKRFDKSTEVYKEFRLFNALVKTTVSDSAIAAAILTEAKSAARRANSETLNKEKSMLIREINHVLNDSNFYYRRIPEYKVYATIQTLLNSWRRGDSSDLSKTVQYESRIVEHLLCEKNKKEDLAEIENKDVDALVVKIMTEKINKKYAGKLNTDQRDLLRDYVFFLSEEKEVDILNRLSEVKEKTLNDLDEYKRSTDNKVILEKIDIIIEKIQSEKIEEVNDQTISRFMTVSQLKNELKEALNE
tara:strand:- start:11895 stop:12752 length:858 start_codon:yes stop_codon:yes gene_type:complete